MLVITYDVMLYYITCVLRNFILYYILHGHVYRSYSELSSLKCCIDARDYILRYIVVCYICVILCQIMFILCYIVFYIYVILWRHPILGVAEMLVVLPVQTPNLSMEIATSEDCTLN